MESDGYSLFTECHRLYMHGMRRALREGLESAYGEEWFRRGVLLALTERQRETIEAELARWPDPDYANQMDTGHFGRILRWNHGAVFASHFPELELAMGQFNTLRQMRNDWAHVLPGALSPQRAVSAAQLMREHLLKLNCEEAILIDSILKDGKIQDVENPMLELVSPAERPDDYNDDEQADEAPVSPGTLWHTLRGYLVSECLVEPIQVTGEESRPREAQVSVTIRISNVAPSGDNAPEVIFENVELQVPLAQQSSRDSRIGTLEPGQTVESQFTLPEKAAADFEYRVSGNVDHRRYFRIQVKGGLPGQLVGQVLNDFVQRFDSIEIGEPFNRALAAISVVRPTMSLADAAVVRVELTQLQPAIEERIAGVTGLLREFHLRRRESALGSHCNDIVALMRDLSSNLQAMDDAIGGTDLEAIDEAVKNLRQLQLAVLQVEETVRRIRNA